MDIQGINTYRAQLDRTSLERADGTERAKENAAPAAPSQPAASIGDKVSVSADAMLRTAALSTALNTPDVRQDKIDALKQQISDGTYKIDSEKIAAKLLEDEILF
jgi:negative regulator of flagellin synthesis FlgM